MIAFLTLVVLVLAATVGHQGHRIRQQRRELDSLWSVIGHRKQRPTKHWLPAVAVVFMSSASAIAVPNEAAASLDRSQFPQESWPYLYYYSTDCVDGEEQQKELDTALKLVIPSMSRQDVLERCTPVAVTPACHRIDLRDLQWDATAWGDLVGRHPYAAEPYPLVVRGDWLLLNLTDAHDSDAYYRLMFGGKAPATRQDALKFLGVSEQVNLQFGMIEGDSGVSVQGVRLIKNLAALRGYAWGTNDVLQLDSEQDPLEQPENDFRHDGEEWIIGLPKTHLATGTRGALQYYFLANGQGKIVDRAPVDLVEDSLKTAGVAEIVNGISCIGCHRSGLNEPTLNELRATIAAGVDAYSDYFNQQQIESFHFADLAKEIKRNNEDFAAIVVLACGLPPEMASLAYRNAVRRYEEPVTLERAAYELRCPPDELKLALGLASASGVKLTARLSGLAHGRTCPRRAWETHYLTVQDIYRTWKGGR